MPIDVKAPEVGDGVTHATVAGWHKKVGERVEEGELLVDVSTDKAAFDVTAPASGTLTERLVEIDTEVEVGQVIARIEP